MLNWKGGRPGYLYLPRQESPPLMTRRCMCWEKGLAGFLAFIKGCREGDSFSYSCTFY